MSTRTVDWTGLRTRIGAAEAEGLSSGRSGCCARSCSTPREMFVEWGFEAVASRRVAEACGVSEKTVFNYFPTKESLVLDRLESTMASLKIGLAHPEPRSRRHGGSWTTSSAP